MKRLLFACSLCFLISCQSNKENSSSIDLASVDMFFELADKIKTDQTVEEAEWDSLFATSGYALITKRIYHKDEIRELMDIAFNKQRQAFRDSLINTPMEELMENPSLFASILMLDNFVEMDNNWDALKKFRKTYNFGMMEKKAIKQLKDFLIDPIDSLIIFPIVSMVCMDREGRSLNEGIVVDFNLLYKMPDPTIGILAHEMFHTYQSSLCDDDYIYTNSVVAAVNLLMNEGLADLVDKKDPMQMLDGVGVPEVVKERYKYAYENTPKILKELDEMAMRYINGEIEQQEFWEEAFDHIVFEGHPNGFYMTSVIQKHGLKKELLAHMNDPVEFAKIYNKAAQLENIYMFSDEFIAYLENYRTEYKSKIK